MRLRTLNQPIADAELSERIEGLYALRRHLSGLGTQADLEFALAVLGVDDVDYLTEHMAKHYERDSPWRNPFDMPIHEHPRNTLGRRM